MQVEGQEVQLAAGITPVLYPFAAQCSRNSFASFATVKAAARATIRNVSKAGAPERLLGLQDVAEELLLAASVQMNLERAHTEVHNDAVPSHAEDGCVVHDKQASAGIQLGMQLPDQAELMGFQVGNYEKAPVRGHVSCSDDEGDGDDVSCDAPVVTGGAADDVHVHQMTTARDALLEGSDGTEAADRATVAYDTGTCTMAVTATDALGGGSEQDRNIEPGMLSSLI